MTAWTLPSSSWRMVMLPSEKIFPLKVQAMSILPFVVRVPSKTLPSARMVVGRGGVKGCLLEKGGSGGSSGSSGAEEGSSWMGRAAAASLSSMLSRRRNIALAKRSFLLITEILTLLMEEKCSEADSFQPHHSQL